MKMAKTEVLPVDFLAPSQSAVCRTAEILLSGGLVVAPTDTRYGLLARADRQEIVEKLCYVKGRPLTNPISLFLENPDDISRFGTVNAVADCLARAFLPGLLTLVLQSLCDWPPPRVIDGKIGIRCSSAPLICRVLEIVDFPATATSANRSGGRNCDSVQEIVEDFGSTVDLYLDAGPLSGKPSSVVDCSRDEVCILREGAINACEIEQAVGKLNEQ